MNKINVLNMTGEELIDLSAEMMEFEQSDFLPERRYKEWWNPVNNIQDAMKLQDYVYKHDLAGYYIERLKETFPNFNKNQVGFVALMNANPKQRTQAALMAWNDNKKE